MCKFNDSNALFFWMLITTIPLNIMQILRHKLRFLREKKNQFDFNAWTKELVLFLVWWVSYKQVISYHPKNELFLRVNMVLKVIN